MTPTTHLYDALQVYLRQCQIVWRDVRHLQTLCWMMIGMIESEKVHPSGFGVYVKSRAQKAQSYQRRFRRWLGNRRIDKATVHQQLMHGGLIGMGHNPTTVPELGYDDAMERFLCDLGGCGVSGSDGAPGLSGVMSKEQ